MERHLIFKIMTEDTEVEVTIEDLIQVAYNNKQIKLPQMVALIRLGTKKEKKRELIKILKKKLK